MGIKAVGFDLDGTLYPGWKLYSVSLGLALRHPRVFSAYGSARKLLHRMAGYSDGPVSAASLRTFQAERVGLSLGIPATTAGMLVQKLCYDEVEAKFASIRPFGGVAPCLAALGGAGLALGLLSDLPPQKKLDLLGLSNYFQTALCSETYGNLKPASAPFIALAGELGVKPEEMVYVGNKLEFDTAGARAAGMKTAHLGGSGLSGGKGRVTADYHFKSFARLTEWILGLMRQDAPQN